jgi:hypothetical protein
VGGAEETKLGKKIMAQNKNSQRGGTSDNDRTHMASRLATANAGHALEEGLTMDFIDPNDTLDHDADFIHDKHIMDIMDRHVPVRGELMKGGRRASNCDIAAIMKEKEEATKNLERNGKHILKNLDKMVHNLKLNREQCQHLMQSDQEEIDELNRELANITIEKGRVLKQLSTRLVRKDKLQRSMGALDMSLGDVISKVKTTSYRHQRTERSQTTAFIEQSNTVNRGYTFERVSLLPKDLLPLSFRSVEANKLRASHSLPGLQVPLVTSPKAPKSMSNPLLPRNVL